MSSLIPLGIIALLVLLNGLFVAAEFGIVTAPRATIERRAAAGQRGAAVVARILTDPQAQDRYIATAQLGVTFASLGLGMYGEHALAGWLEGAFDGWAGIPPWLAANTIASIVAVGLLTYVHIVLGEMVPKSLALHYGEDTALRVTPPMIFAGRVFFPLVVALNAASSPSVVGWSSVLPTAAVLAPPPCAACCSCANAFALLVLRPASAATFRARA